MDTPGSQPPVPPTTSPGPPSSAPAPSSGIPLAQPVAPAPTAPPPAAATYTAPTYAAPAARSSWGWKAFAIISVVFILALFGCCALSLTMLADSDAPTVAIGDAIAVIHVNGIIAGTGSSVNGYVTPEEFIGQLDQAADDPNVKAVVLRVDSPGGTVAASEEIATELKRFEKPVVVSVGDVDASGAYMVSSQADVIMANRTSTVGSIGVITEIPNVSGLLEKVGVEFTVLTAGEYKDAGSPFRSLTATETELIQHEIDIAYEEFIKIVAEGRGLDEAAVRELATGWAWSAVEAKDMGLVDELGTYSDALDRAAELGEIDGDYQVIDYDEVTFEDFFTGFLGVKESLDRLGTLGTVEQQPGPAVPR